MQFTRSINYAHRLLRVHSDECRNIHGHTMSFIGDMPDDCVKKACNFIDTNFHNKLLLSKEDPLITLDIDNLVPQEDQATVEFMLTQIATHIGNNFNFMLANETTTNTIYLKRQENRNIYIADKLVFVETCITTNGNFLGKKLGVHLMVMGDLNKDLMVIDFGLFKPVVNWVKENIDHSIIGYLDIGTKCVPTEHYNLASYIETNAESILGRSVFVHIEYPMDFRYENAQSFT